MIVYVCVLGVSFSLHFCTLMGGGGEGGRIP